MYTTMRQERIKQGWTCEYVAKKVGLTPEAIRLLEMGQRKPSYNVLVRLEDLFQIGHRDLFRVVNPKLDKENDTNKRSRKDVTNERSTDF